MARSNAELVTTVSAEVTPRGIVATDDVERPVDAIIYGTGFDVQDFLTPMRVFGRGGIELNKLWSHPVQGQFGGSNIDKTTLP